MRKLFLLAVLLLVFHIKNDSITAQNDNTDIKKIAETNSFFYVICKTERDDCFGFGPSKIHSSAPRDGMIESIVVSDSVIYVLDNHFLKVTELDLLTGKILNKSDEFTEEIVASIMSLFLFNNHLCILSQYNDYLYVLDRDLNIYKKIKFPYPGAWYQLFFINDKYVIKTTETYTTGYDKAFTLMNDFTIENDIIESFKSEQFDTIYASGKPVTIEKRDNIFFLKNEFGKFEVPESITKLDFYDRCVNYDENTIVYVVRHPLKYELIVCRY